MVKDYLKRLRKMPPHFQFKFINIIDSIEKGNLDELDIKELSGRKGFFRCRLGKFRIIFYKNLDGDYIIEEIGSRGDIYK